MSPKPKGNKRYIKTTLTAANLFHSEERAISKDHNFYFNILTPSTDIPLQLP